MRNSRNFGFRPRVAEHPFGLFHHFRARTELLGRGRVEQFLIRRASHRAKANRVAMACCSDESAASG